MLQPYASHPQRTRGRRYATEPAPTRNEFQRDRDRIVHSTAFRRLVYKTQVFLNHEGDLFRTRLTHSIEVAQLARSMARSLGLHEDLCEASSLAHDLGHTPFGHAGQDALNECVRAVAPASSGFEHNFQSLRVVDVLEEQYPEHDGLNLTFETREGILKHCSLRHAQELEAAEPAGVGRRFIERTQPSLEAQLCNLADEIAYNAHDIDDGVRSGLLVYEQLLELGIWRRFHEDALARHPQLAGRRLLYETNRRVLSHQVYDLVQTSAELIRRHAPADAQQVRHAPTLIRFSEQLSAEVAEVKDFLRTRLYRHERVLRQTTRAKAVVRELFALFHARPELMPGKHALRQPTIQAVVDYIAGMTDRFAHSEHARLTALAGAPLPR